MIKLLRLELVQLQHTAIVPLARNQIAERIRDANANAIRVSSMRNGPEEEKVLNRFTSWVILTKLNSNGL